MNDKAMFLRILRPAMRFVNKFIFRLEYNGVENIPEGKCILAGNHSSICDCLPLVGATKEPPHFLVKKELHSTKIGNWFFTNSGTIPVDRSKKNPKAMCKAEEMLNRGHKIAIYPEGTINKTEDTIMPFKFGAVKLASDTNSPIIPFALKGKFRPFRKGLSINFCEPIIVGDDLEEANNKLMSVVKNKLEEKDER